jgi:hypothetical protein
MLCECVVCELTSWVEFIMFVFRRSRDRHDRHSRAGPTARVLKRPNRPEPVMGPRPRAVFFLLFFPPAYYLGSLDRSETEQGDLEAACGAATVSNSVSKSLQKAVRSQKDLPQQAAGRPKAGCIRAGQTLLTLEGERWGSGVTPE